MARVPLRPWLVVLHRYAGLLTAAFLLLTALTGSVLAWYHELDAAVNARWMRASPPSPDAVALHPLELRERVLQAYPKAQVHHVRLRREPGAAATFWLAERTVPGEPDEVFVDPYTGQVLGARRWGDLGEGWTNLMPFLYRLHYQLALGSFGSLVLGIVALAWTIDCVVGAALTFPTGRSATKQGWWSGWWRAWQVRRGRGTYATRFDLHRAASLWFWAMLFVFAWSSVGLNLPQAYRPLMGAVFEHQDTLPERAADAGTAPPMPWQQALRTGEKRMAELATAEGFVVEAPDRLVYDPERGLFRYVATTDRDVAERFGSTSVWFDAATGRAVAGFVPTGKAGGDTVTTWLTALHMAALWGAPYRLFVTLLGGVTATLVLTGLYLWWRKRRARAHPQPRPV